MVVPQDTLLLIANLWRAAWCAQLNNISGQLESTLMPLRLHGSHLGECDPLRLGPFVSEVEQVSGVRKALQGPLRKAIHFFIIMMQFKHCTKMANNHITEHKAV